MSLIGQFVFCSPVSKNVGQNGKFNFAGKKGGKRCEQRRRWHEFMQHLREEMMAGNYGNWTQSSEDESEAVKPKAAEAEKSGATKKVQFEGKIEIEKCNNNICNVYEKSCSKCMSCRKV